MCLPHDPAEAVGESLVPRGGVVDRDALEGFALSACRVEASAPTVVKFVRNNFQGMQNLEIMYNYMEMGTRIL